MLKWSGSQGWRPSFSCTRARSKENEISIVFHWENKRRNSDLNAEEKFNFILANSELHNLNSFASHGRTVKVILLAIRLCDIYIYVSICVLIPKRTCICAYINRQICEFIQYFARNWPCISVSLGFPYMVSVFPCFPYMVSICPYFLIWYSPLFWVWRCYGLLWTLHCHKDRYCDVTMIWPLLFHGIHADVSETPNNALTTQMHGDYRLDRIDWIDRFFVGFNVICYAFLRNNPIYIEGRNCSFSTVPVLFNKCSGLRSSDTLSSWWLGWRRHALVGKPFFGKWLDL